LGNIGLNSGKISLEVMLFILTSKCSHIIDITGRSEDIKKTLMASTAADDAVELTGNEGTTTYMLQETGSREWVKIIRQLRTIFNSGGPSSSVGIATDYRVDGLGSTSCGDEIFCLSRPNLGPSQPPVQWVPGLYRW